MKTRTEQLELTRRNVTPAQFLAYVRQQIKKHDFNGICAIDICLDDFKRDGDFEFDVDNTHLGPQLSAVHREKSVSKPYEMQTYVLNWDGTVYNHIMEFDFDDDKKGTGYFYYICTVKEEEPAQENNQENSTAAQEGQEGSEMMTVNDLLTMMDLRTIDEVKMYCADGHDLGSMEIETAMDTEYYGARTVKRFGFKHDEIAEFNILVITLADTWHRDGTPENCEFWARVEAENDGEYMVRCYTRAGNLAATYYAGDEKTAAKIRIEYAASLGVYPGDRDHWAIFPTIWKKDAGGEYHRLTKYA
jgi:hypothetical protein